MIMWETADTIRVISCAIGTFILAIAPMNQLGFYVISVFFFIYLIGGVGALILGIMAKVKQSNIGIFGLIQGALVTFAVLSVTFFSFFGYY